MGAFNPTVFVLAPFAHRSGHYGTIAVALANALAGRGLEVEVISSLPMRLTDENSAKSGGLTDALLSLLGSRNEEVGVSRIAKFMEVLCVMIRALRLAYSRRVVVFHFVDATFLLLALWVLIIRKPTVYYLPGSLDSLTSKASAGNYIGRFAARFKIHLLRKAVASRRLAIVSETIEMQQAVDCVLGDAAYVIPYAVTPLSSLPDGAVMRKRLDLRGDALVALLFGTHREGKDYRTVVAAAELAGPNVFLLFVGKVISGNDPEKIAADRSFTRARFVLDFVSEETVPLYFAAADVVVLPYEGDFTRGSGVLLETCRFGRPLIVADTGHLAAFVQKYGCGLLYQQGDPQSLALAMKRIATLDSDELDRMRQGLERAATDHSWQRIVHAYLALYEAVNKGASVSELAPLTRGDIV